LSNFAREDGTALNRESGTPLIRESAPVNLFDPAVFDGPALFDTGESTSSFQSAWAAHANVAIVGAVGVPMKKNVSGQKIGAQLVSATDGSAVTSGTTTVYVTGDAGTQAAGSVGSGACTHEGNGYWTYAPAQAETNYDLIAFTFVNSSAVPTSLQIFTTFPQTGDNYARLGAPAGASVSADVAAAKVDTAAVKVVTDKFLFTATNYLKVDIKYINATPLVGNGSGTPWGS
jgi:hypothetical protein